MCFAAVWGEPQPLVCVCVAVLFAIERLASGFFCALGVWTLSVLRFMFYFSPCMLSLSIMARRYWCSRVRNEKTVCAFLVSLRV